MSFNFRVDAGQTTARTGDIPDAFGDGTATYAIAGDTITFTIDPVGTVAQTCQRG